MPIDPAAPRFPLHEDLVRFFALQGRRRVPLALLADLLGMNPSALRGTLLAEGGDRDVESIPWPEAAAYLFDAWPRVDILAALASDHLKRIPRLFHPTRVNWSIPIFIVRAMEHQAAAAWRRDPRLLASISPNNNAARGIHDYVADLLFNEIQPETQFAFRDDPEFLAAFKYPHD
jgi:hypothetical protein